MTGTARSPSTTPDPARPHRPAQRVDHLVARPRPAGQDGPGPIRPAALAAGELLAGYDAFVPQAAAIAVFHLDLERGTGARLDRLAALTEGRPALAARTAKELAARLQRRRTRGTPRRCSTRPGG